MNLQDGNCQIHIFKEKWQSDDGKRLNRELNTSNHTWNEIELGKTIKFSFETKLDFKVQNSSRWKWNIEFQT